MPLAEFKKVAVEGNVRERVIRRVRVKRMVNWTIFVEEMKV